MLKFVLVSVLWLLVFSTEWDYDESGIHGPSSWSTSFTECGGNRQSPINYIPHSSVFNSGYSDNCESQSFIQFDTTHTTFRMFNNGHSFVLIAIDSNGKDLTDNQTTINKIKNTQNGNTNYHSMYCLDSIHFHFGANNSVGSEHFINGIQYPLEAHFVHYSCDFKNITYALAEYSNGNLDIDSTTDYDTNVLAVISVMYSVSNSDNSVFTNIVDNIPLIETEEDGSVEITLNAMNLMVSSEEELETFVNEIYIYEGSLTTPPCSEIVLWHLSTNVLTISQSQLDILYLLKYGNSNTTFDEIGNFRPLQTNPNTLYSQECKESNAISIEFINCNKMFFVLISFIVLFY